jgi:hypothetical protein
LNASHAGDDAEAAVLRPEKRSKLLGSHGRRNNTGASVAYMRRRLISFQNLELGIVVDMWVVSIAFWSINEAHPA